jgi:hypothetical protein
MEAIAKKNPTDFLSSLSPEVLELIKIIYIDKRTYMTNSNNDIRTEGANSPVSIGDQSKVNTKTTFSFLNFRSSIIIGAVSAVSLLGIIYYIVQHHFK